MKIYSKNVAAAVAVALMLSGAISTPALAASKKPINIKSSAFITSCSGETATSPQPFLERCIIGYGERHAFVQETADGFVATRGRVKTPGVVIGTYATMTLGLAAARTHMKAYTD